MPHATARRWPSIASGCTFRRAPSATICPSAIGKTGAANRAEAVLVAVENGWL